MRQARGVATGGGVQDPATRNPRTSSNRGAAPLSTFKKMNKYFYCDFGAHSKKWAKTDDFSVFSGGYLYSFSDLPPQSNFLKIGLAVQYNFKRLLFVPIADRIPQVLRCSRTSGACCLCHLVDRISLVHTVGQYNSRRLLILASSFHALRLTNA